MGFVALTYVAWYRDADLRGDGPRYLGALQHVKPCTFAAVKREAPHRCCLRFFCSPGCAQGTCFSAAVPNYRSSPIRLVLYFRRQRSPCSIWRTLPGYVFTSG